MNGDDLGAPFEMSQHRQHPSAGVPVKDQPSRLDEHGTAGQRHAEHFPAGAVRHEEDASAIEENSAGAVDEARPEPLLVRRGQVLARIQEGAPRLSPPAARDALSTAVVRATQVHVRLAYAVLGVTLGGGS